MSYRVDVVASSVADAVRRAGGWIFDRSMQGRVVNVVIPIPAILGRLRSSKPASTRRPITNTVRRRCSWI